MQNMNWKDSVSGHRVHIVAKLLKKIKIKRRYYEVDGKRKNPERLNLIYKS